jgi:hypothetical protein
MDAIDLVGAIALTAGVATVVGAFAASRSPTPERARDAV